MSRQIPIVVLDACVIFPAPVRDFLLHLAIQNLSIPKWSEKIQEEWVKNLLLKRPDLSRTSLNKTVNAMNQAFEEANVEENKALEEKIFLPDMNDRHVLATALKAKASYILTFNLKDFPNKYLDKYQILAIPPDDFLDRFILEFPKEVKSAFNNQIKNLKNPPIKPIDLLKIFSKVGLPKTAMDLEFILEN